MIVYQLSCQDGHDFEGWFASADAFDRQADAGQLACPACGTAEVRKLPSAPHVHTTGMPPPAEPKIDKDAERRRALQSLKTFLLANTDDVGRRFAEIARRIHYKEEESRGIRGQVTPDEAEELREEGVPAYPVPPEIVLGEDIQ